VSHAIRLLSEVEKMWIAYNMSKEETLNFSAVSEYLNQTAYPDIRFSEQELKDMFLNMDIDYQGHISKSEMFHFFNVLLTNQ